MRSKVGSRTARARRWDRAVRGKGQNSEKRGDRLRAPIRSEKGPAGQNGSQTKFDQCTALVTRSASKNFGGLARYAESRRVHGDEIEPTPSFIITFATAAENVGPSWRRRRGERSAPCSVNFSRPRIRAFPRALRGSCTGTGHGWRHPMKETGLAQPQLEAVFGRHQVLAIALAEQARRNTTATCGSRLPS